jgi:hypothetical protein
LFQALQRFPPTRADHIKDVNPRDANPKDAKTRDAKTNLGNRDARNKKGGTKPH